MNKIVLLISLCFVALNVYSKNKQNPKQKLYFSNGNIAFDGNYITTWSETEPFEYLKLNEFKDEAITNQYKNNEGQMLFAYKNLIPNRIYQGLCKFYYPSGALMAEGVYLNGYKNGDFKLYHANGKLSALQSYINGMANGKWETWDSTGKLTSQFFYKPFSTSTLEEVLSVVTTENFGKTYNNDKYKYLFNNVFTKLESSELFTIYKNPILKFQQQNINKLIAKLSKISFYAKGQKEGTFKVWENNQLTLLMQFKDNFPTGKWVMYEKDNPIFEIEIKNDKIVAAKDYIDDDNNFGTKGYKVKVQKELEAKTNEGIYDIGAVEPGLSNRGWDTPKPEPVNTKNNEIFRVVEQVPSSPYNFNEYVLKNIKYTKEELEEAASTRAVVEFVVFKDGSLGNVKILRSINASVNASILKAIQRAPKWIPAKQNGQVVNCYMTIPIQLNIK